MFATTKFAARICEIRKGLDPDTLARVDAKLRQMGFATSGKAWALKGISEEQLQQLRSVI